MNSIQTSRLGSDRRPSPGAALDASLPMPSGFRVFQHAIQRRLGRNFGPSLKYVLIACSLLILSASLSYSQTVTAVERSLSGVVITDKNEAVPGATVVAQYSAGKKKRRQIRRERFI